MLRNEMHITTEDDYPKDWSYWSIKIDRLNAQRSNAMNEGKWKRAMELWFAVQDAELELGKTIGMVFGE